MKGLREFLRDLVLTEEERWLRSENLTLRNEVQFLHEEKQELERELRAARGAHTRRSLWRARS